MAALLEPSRLPHSSSHAPSQSTRLDYAIDLVAHLVMLFNRHVPLSCQDISACQLCLIPMSIADRTRSISDRASTEPTSLQTSSIASAAQLQTLQSRRVLPRRQRHRIIPNGRRLPVRRLHVCRPPLMRGSVASGSTACSSTLYR